MYFIKEKQNKNIYYYCYLLLIYTMFSKRKIIMFVIKLKETIS